MLKELFIFVGDVLYTSFVTFPRSWRTYIASVCKHQTKRIGVVSAYGTERFITLPLNHERSVSYCLACHARMAIRCGKDEHAIFPGDIVSLWRPDDPDFELPDGALRYQEGKTISIIACNEPHGDSRVIQRVGRWIPPGEIMRVPGALERAQEGATPLLPGKVLWTDGQYPVRGQKWSRYQPPTIYFSR